MGFTVCFPQNLGEGFKLPGFQHQRETQTSFRVLPIQQTQTLIQEESGGETCPYLLMAPVHIVPSGERAVPPALWTQGDRSYFFGNPWSEYFMLFVKEKIAFVEKFA